MYMSEKMTSHVSSSVAAAAAGVDDDGGLLRASRALAWRHLGPRWGDPEEMETGGAPHRGPKEGSGRPRRRPGSTVRCCCLLYGTFHALGHPAKDKTRN
ncbi:hypothetical protein MRX96_030356 [Rhipicephalus microplus]